MATRLAACDPCRIAKVACDHTRPVCIRCTEKNLTSRCRYRERPFKRCRTPHPTRRSERSEQRSVGETVDEVNDRNYPNPGFLGRSSHASIFEKIAQGHPVGDTAAIGSFGSQDVSPKPLRSRHRNSDDGRWSSLVEDVHESLDLDRCIRLIRSWRAKGANLALAGSFLDQCVIAVDRSFCGAVRTGADLTKTMCTNSSKPLYIDATTDLERWTAQFSDANIRWESLGLCLVAVCRAAVEHGCCEGMTIEGGERNAILTRALRLADECLEIALSVDCLNDLQLTLQYENWIAHSTVDGDQSKRIDRKPIDSALTEQGYRSWRKLGDVISSLFALGYHAVADPDAGVPGFMRTLRNTAMARAYSADKNVSIFLGRPPRMHRKHCHIERVIAGIEKESSVPGILWNPDAVFDYHIETKWTASCAILKERILDLPTEEERDRWMTPASTIVDDAHAQWRSLPAQFRLEESLSQTDGRSPIELDFLSSAKMNYLHVLFLLRVAMSRQMAELDAELIRVSTAMLSLVVESVILKAHLVNSGTGLVWRVAYYGLPAAGIICLALLNRQLMLGGSESCISRAIRDLSVLVAHLDAGTLIEVGEPNYALLSGAIGTVRTVLDRVMRDLYSSDMLLSRPTAEAEDGLDGQESWMLPRDGWDFEVDFWQHLADHPELSLSTVD